MRILTLSSSLDTTVLSLGIDEVFTCENAAIRDAPLRLSLEMSSVDCVLPVCLRVLRARISSLEPVKRGMADEDGGLGIPEYFAITAAAAAEVEEGAEGILEW